MAGDDFDIAPVSFGKSPRAASQARLCLIGSAQEPVKPA
jgi:hypothetical protein